MHGLVALFDKPIDQGRGQLCIYDKVHNGLRR